VLDEPSVGLHAADVHKLIDVLQQLVDQDNTVLIIEHHPDIIKVADWVIDLGPEGGDGGGQIITEGTPEEIVKIPASYTGQFLKKHL
jgi:excinuclease ABC subunit A